jgi:hypothetical protein
MKIIESQCSLTDMNKLNKLLQSNIIAKAPYPKNLFQLASVLPSDGVGMKLAPVEWIGYNFSNNYYKISHVKLTPVFIIIFTLGFN